MHYLSYDDNVEETCDLIRKELNERLVELKDENKIVHNKKEINEAQCQIQTDTYHDFYVCAADTIFSKEYFFEFLNDLSGEWVKNPE